MVERKRKCTKIGQKGERVDAMDKHKVSICNSNVTYQFGYICILNLIVGNSTPGWFNVKDVLTQSTHPV